ncbi:hypothetical protein BFS06_14460 [Clostridium perfringens]|uniref:Uncharacterized protein n=1 Tax=Clostridium perfringens TaxID=1502 RepID=A0A140GRB7_CLOPF|nr:hypothetical protein [Clostridium perfringens]AMN31076.1 hypothetical protein JFP838_pA0160 [Clostridium perfringens]TBX14408.1 hypothetical protein BFS06_14460 [Clostridium perfringens]
MQRNLLITLDKLKKSSTFKKEKSINLSMSMYELGVIITGLKISNAIDNVLCKKLDNEKKILIKRLSELREISILNKDKTINLNLNINEITMIIVGLKISKVFDDVIDEELEIKYNRGKKNKANIC